MTTPSSIPDTGRVNFEAAEEWRARVVVHQLVLAVEAVQGLGAPYDGALGPLLCALTLTARTADVLREDTR